MRQRAANAMFAGLSDDADWEAFEAAAREGAVDPQGQRFTVSANDHGTHVAGVLAGGPFGPKHLEDHWAMQLRGDEPGGLRGICPTLRLIDVQVFDRNGRSREFEVVVGLAFIAWLNRRPNNRIDGVNVSLSIPFAIDNFACGGTPVCMACDKLVADGLVVVASAGNSGYDDSRGTTTLGSGFQMMSISDPGNADDVITVGATHRTDPHRYGPISRSARGPTADGRNKPDLLAPGDRVWGPVPGQGWGQKSGTSQAAPHVSGVAAMLLARYPELRGRPRRIKAILCETATDLGRLVHFQGHGLVDALRALQRP
jgi:subtilisin family serine protease